LYLQFFQPFGNLKLYIPDDLDIVILLDLPETGFSLHTFRNPGSFHSWNCRDARSSRFPPSTTKLRRTDWDIIRALRKDPRRSPSEIAQVAGVSTRTVRRRLKVMTEGRAFYLLPILDYDEQVGASPDYLVCCPDETKKQLIDKQVRSKLDRIVFSFTDAPGFSIYAMVCKNLSEAEEIRGWIKGMEGVQDVMMDTMRSNSVVNGWLDQEIERHLT